MKRWHATGLLLICPFICFWKIFLAPNDYSFFVSNDAAQHWYPWYQYIGKWVHAGILPLWDVALQSGRPLLGEMRPGLLYPFNLLLFRTSSTAEGIPIFYLNLLIVLAVFMASVFQYRLSRHLGCSRYASGLAAIVYGYCGYVAENATWQIAILHGAIWLPLLVLLFLKSYQAPAGISRTFFLLSCGAVLGMMFLAGHLQPPIHAAASLAVLAVALASASSAARILWARGVVYFTVIVLSGCLTAAPQLVAAWEYGALAVRWLGWEELPPVSGLARIPYAWGGHFERGRLQDIFTAVNPGTWAGSDYFGVAPVFLAVLGFFFARCAAARLFKILLIFGAVMWLGELSIFHGLVYHLVPLMDKVRQPSRVIFVVHLCTAILAGFGTDLLIRSIRSRYKKAHYFFARLFFWATALVVTAVFVTGMLAIVLKASSMKSESLEWTFRFALLLLISASLFYLRQTGWIRLAAFRKVLLLLVTFDLFSMFSYNILSRHGYSQTNYFAPVHYAPNEVLRFLKTRANEGLFRVQVLDDALPFNSGMVHGYQEVDGFTATGLEKYQEFRALDWNPQSTIVRLLNRRYIVSRSELQGFRQIIDGPIRVYEDTEAAARVAWIPRALVLESLKSVGEALKSGRFKPSELVLVTRDQADLIPQHLCAVSSQDTTGPPAGRVNIVSYDPNRIVLGSSAPEDGIVLLSEIAYPGWQASIDGKAVPIVTANYLLRSLVVTQGVHRIELVYRPSLFYLALGCSLAVLVCWLVLGIMLACTQRSRLSVTGHFDSFAKGDALPHGRATATPLRADAVAQASEAVKKSASLNDRE